jgi:hypothetical protein
MPARWCRQGARTEWDGAAAWPRTGFHSDRFSETTGNRAANGLGEWDRSRIMGAGTAIDAAASDKPGIQRYFRGPVRSRGPQ